MGHFDKAKCIFTNGKNDYGQNDVEDNGFFLAH